VSSVVYKNQRNTHTHTNSPKPRPSPHSMTKWVRTRVGGPWESSKATIETTAASNSTTINKQTTPSPGKTRVSGSQVIGIEETFGVIKTIETERKTAAQLFMECQVR
jgi:hypothetical protein